MVEDKPVSTDFDLGQITSTLLWTLFLLDSSLFVLDQLVDGTIRQLEQSIFVVGLSVWWKAVLEKVDGVARLDSVIFWTWCCKRGAEDGRSCNGCGKKPIGKHREF